MNENTKEESDAKERLVLMGTATVAAAGAGLWFGRSAIRESLEAFGLLSHGGYPTVFGIVFFLAVLAALLGVSIAGNSYSMMVKWRERNPGGPVPHLHFECALGIVPLLTALGVLTLPGWPGYVKAAVVCAPLTLFIPVFSWAGKQQKRWVFTQILGQELTGMLGWGHHSAGRVTVTEWVNDQPHGLVIKYGPGWRPESQILGEINRLLRANHVRAHVWKHDPNKRVLIGTPTDHEDTQPRQGELAPGGAFLGVRDDKTMCFSDPRGALLVIGPPKSGKTQGAIIPSVLTAPGACISTSIKPEVLVETLAYRRQFGRCWFFDPGGEERPDGVTLLRWNPLVDVASWDDAIAVAQRLVDPLRKGEDGNSAHFFDRAKTWLSTFLYACFLSGSDLITFRKWCFVPIDGSDDASEQLEKAIEKGDEAAEIAHDLLQGLVNTPDKERGAIASTLTRCMEVYSSPAAMTAGHNPNFHAEKFVRSKDTLYIAVPAEKTSVYAPLVAALIESIRFAQYARWARVQKGLETNRTPLTGVFDECANTAPIPIPKMVSEAGGQGFHLCCAFQDLTQAEAQWGKAADGFVSMFPDKAILAGMFNSKTAEVISQAFGDYDRLTVSQRENKQITPNPNLGESVSYQGTRARVLPVSEIMSVPKGKTLHIQAGSWELVNQLRWYEPAWNPYRGTR